MEQTTLIYCSSNMEKPEFEERIRANILKYCGDLPIVSVTQKPIDFGENICVGADVGVSGFNFFRQSLLACKAAKTKFVTSIEADCVYPPDYFEYIPPREDMCYRNSNLYVMPQHRAFFWKKPWGATHAQVVGREFYIKTLEKWFKGEPMWDAEQKNFPKEKTGHKCEDVFWGKGKSNEIEFFETENPVVQIKTSQSMRHHTTTEREDVDKLPFWGTGRQFRKNFYDIGYRH